MSEWLCMSCKIAQVKQVMEDFLSLHTGQVLLQTLGLQELPDAQDFSCLHGDCGVSHVKLACP